MTQIFAALAAAFSALAALLTAIATWRAPRSAAKLAEEMRREGDAAARQTALRLQVFSVLMQERASIWSPAAVQNLNLIDVVFNDVPGVRDAWAELYGGFSERSQIPMHVREERMRKLIFEMAKVLGLATNLRPDDFARVYLPTIIWKQHEIQRLQQDHILRSLRNADSSEANVAVSQTASTIWPPPPTD
jgi:hypothetical protein